MPFIRPTGSIQYNNLMNNENNIISCSTSSFTSSFTTRLGKASRLTICELDGTLNYLFTASLTPSSSISASYAETASYYLESDPIFSSKSGSFISTSSFDSFTGSYNTGSFTGSFKGDGSQLNGIVSSKWTGSNKISREGNVEITGSLNVTAGITGSLHGNSTSSSYALSASNSITSISSSYALTASYVENFSNIGENLFNYYNFY